MSNQVVLRAFRSPDLRDLTRMAIEQGWAADRTGGGHVRVVNPANGQRVILSATSAGNVHGLANARAAFRRAGLILGDRSRPQEVPMEQTDASLTDAPDAPAQDRHGLRPGGRRAGGSYALVSPKEATDILGQRVLVGERVDGNWVAEMPDPTRKSGRRQWMSKDGREALVARITDDLANNRPSRTGPRYPGAIGAEAIPPASAPALPPFVAERVPERYTNGHAPVGPYPIAAGLDRLHSTVAPALAALEAAGKTDAAALLREELALTPVEEELLSLWRSVRGD